MSVDPSRKSVKETDPQSWNRYSYTLNNPLKYVDHNGKWPTEIHNLIIDKTFRGLTKEQRQVIKDASYEVDDPLLFGQATVQANEHGMTKPGQSQDDAAKKANDFINQNLYQAQTSAAKRKGVGGTELHFFGRAWHTVSDMTSPMHEGYQVWHITDAYKHSQGESMEEFDNYRLGLAVGASINLYAFTFGQEELHKALGYTPGSANDPNIQEIRNYFNEDDASRDYEIYQYRIGLDQGLKFDWTNQHRDRQ